MASDLKQLAESFGRNMTYADGDMVSVIQTEDGSNPAEGKDAAAAGHLTHEMVDELREKIADTDLEILHQEESVVRHDLWVVVG